MAERENGKRSRRRRRREVERTKDSQASVCFSIPLRLLLHPRFGGSNSILIFRSLLCSSGQVCASLTISASRGIGVIGLPSSETVWLVKGETGRTPACARQEHSSRCRADVQQQIVAGNKIIDRQKKKRKEKEKKRRKRKVHVTSCIEGSSAIQFPLLSLAMIKLPPTTTATEQQESAMERERARAEERAISRERR